jgi:propanol-preferring alcohol dehydrogenase
VQDGQVEILDVADPIPGHEEVRVRLTASGVCHSDLHIARGDWSGMRSGGLLGHEGIGVVDALGPGADGAVEVGDRVILGLGGACGHWCGACEYCLKGEPRHCRQSRSIMGTFAESICVWGPSLVKLPDSVADQDAPLACGGLTAYGAVKKLLKHHVLPGRPVAVIGAAGGLGHYAVQIASTFGYRVVGVDIGAERLEFVRSLGAVAAVEADDAAAFATEELGGCDAALVFSARIAGFQLGLRMLRRGGLWVGVGLPPSSEGSLQINPFEFFFLDPTLIYSVTGTVQDMRELVELAAAGKVKTHVSRTGSLSQLPGIFDDLQAGRYLGRAVLTDLRN